MLVFIAVILVFLWLLGLITSYTMGGLIHILLLGAIAMILIRVVHNRYQWEQMRAEWKETELKPPVS